MKIKICLLLLFLTPTMAYAPGGSIHMWMTSVAIGKMSNTDAQTFLRKHRDYVLNGSTFPDTGYASVLGSDTSSSESYGEIAHWPPFINAGIAYIKSLCRNGSGKIVLEGECAGLTAYFFGSAAHAMEDIFYDSQFLDELVKRGYYPNVDEAQNGDTNIDLYAVGHLFPASFNLQTLPDPIFRASFQHMTNIVNQTGGGYVFPVSIVECGMETLYGVLMLERLGATFYTPPVLDWAVEHIFDGRGGVDEASTDLVNFWQELWIQITETPAADYHSKTLVSSGGWPYVTVTWANDP